MFLVVVGKTFVFLETDPREEGFPDLIVEDGVSLIFEPNCFRINENSNPWKRVAKRPDNTDITGQNPLNKNEYRVFPSSSELYNAGFEPLSMIRDFQEPPILWHSWNDYLRLRQQVAESTT